MPPPVGRPISACPSSIACSIRTSSSSGSLVPPAANSLIPLSGIGLCEAESITPRSALVCATKYATAGVGSTPTRTTLAPALVSPATTAASSISPLARGSRPTIASGWWLRSLSTRTRAAATATERASSGVRSPLARPRTPSVPNSRPIGAVLSVGCKGFQWSANAFSEMQNGRARPRLKRGRTRPPDKRSALRVLRSLTGLLETVLLALLDPGVPGQEAGLLQGGTVVRVVRDQRAGDAEAQRTGLAGDAAAPQVRDDVELLG